MALLGIQLVFSMIMASVLSKLSSHFSVASWILTSRLVRYLHPTDEELRNLTAGGYSKNKARKNYKNHAGGKNEPFSIPKSLDIQLEPAKVQAIDVILMRFYPEFQWLVDFSVCALFIYIPTEAYYTLMQPKNEYNLSMMWAILVIGFCLKVLFSLTAMYFSKDGGGEWVICVVLGLFFLVFAMVILIVNDDILEFELDAAYRNFSAGAKVMLARQGIDSDGPASLLTFRIILAIIAALLGSFLSFPGLRIAKMHLDSLKYAQGRPFLQVLLYTNMIFPLLLSIMWVRPVIRDQLVYSPANNSPLQINPATFEAARIIAVLAFIALRFSLTWTHLQSHLNLACAKMEELKKEAGRISSVDLQKRVAQVFYYLCVVALQYVVPLILLLYCTIMWKTLGEFSWGDAFGIHSPATNTTSSAIKQPPAPLPAEGDVTLAASAAQFSFALRNLQIIFTPVWFRGLFSFLCWWICTAWFTTSAFGLVYYSYFTV